MYIYIHTHTHQNNICIHTYIFPYKYIHAHFVNMYTIYPYSNPHFPSHPPRSHVYTKHHLETTPLPQTTYIVRVQLVTIVCAAVFLCHHLTQHGRRLASVQLARCGIRNLYTGPYREHNLR